MNQVNFNATKRITYAAVNIKMKIKSDSYAIHAAPREKRRSNKKKQTQSKQNYYKKFQPLSLGL